MCFPDGRRDMRCTAKPGKPCKRSALDRTICKNCGCPSFAGETAEPAAAAQPGLRPDAKAWVPGRPSSVGGTEGGTEGAHHDASGAVGGWPPTDGDGAPGAGHSGADGGGGGGSQDASAARFGAAPAFAPAPASAPLLLPRYCSGERVFAEWNGEVLPGTVDAVLADDAAAGVRYRLTIETQQGPLLRGVAVPESAVSADDAAQTLPYPSTFGDAMGGGTDGAETDVTSLVDSALSALHHLETLDPHSEQLRIAIEQLDMCVHAAAAAAASAAAAAAATAAAAAATATATASAAASRAYFQAAHACHPRRYRFMTGIDS